MTNLATSLEKLYNPSSVGFAFVIHIQYIFIIVAQYCEPPRPPPHHSGPCFQLHIMPGASSGRKLFARLRVRGKVGRLKSPISGRERGRLKSSISGRERGRLKSPISGRQRGRLKSSISGRERGRLRRPLIESKRGRLRSFLSEWAGGEPEVTGGRCHGHRGQRADSSL